MADDDRSLLINDNGKKRKHAFIKLFVDHTTKFEKLVFLVGVFGAILCGLTIPVLSIAIGDIGHSLVDVTKEINNKSLDPSELDHALNIFEQEMNRNILFYLVLGFWCISTSWLQATCFLYVGENVTYKLRKNFIRKLLRQDAEWFDRTPSGTLSTLLSDNIERIREGTGDKIGMGVQFFTEFIMGFVIAFWTDWRLALCMSGIAPFTFICGMIITYAMATTAKKQSKVYGRASAIATQAVGSIKTVVALNGQKQEIESYQKELQLAKKMGVRKGAIVGIASGSQFFLINSMRFASTYIGASYVNDGSANPGTLMTVFFAVMFGSFALAECWPYVSAIASASGSAAPILDVFHESEDAIENNTEDKKVPHELGATVQFQNVSFSYPSRPDVHVLKEISFKADEGETIALVGASGSGKSTVVQLLLRFYEQSAGMITIDGHDIGHIDLKFLRKFIGVVSQEPVLFNATIEQNILFGNPHANKSEILAALRKANAYDFVMQFPQGLKTLVGERGTQLSGGQKQRIAIARALLRNPRILLLDEATSALDSESETIVQKALENASQGRTTIVVAHRLSTIRNANRILVMKHGKIVETGTHDELLSAGGVYSDLVQAQALAEADQDDTDPHTPLSRLSSFEYPQDLRRLHSQRSTSSTERPEAVVHDDDLDRMKHELAEEGAKRASWFSIVSKCRSDWIIITLGFLACAFQGIVMPAFAQLEALLVDAFSTPGAQMLEHVHFYACLFLAVGLLKGVMYGTQFAMFGAAAERLSYRLRLESFAHLLRLPCSFYDCPTHSPTRLSTRLSTDASNVKAAVDYRMGSVLTTLVSAVIGLFVSFYFGWKMATLIACTFPVLMIAEYYFQKHVEGTVTLDSKALENCNKTAVEALENIKTVRALNMEDQVMNMLEVYLEDAHAKNQKQAFIQGFAYGVSNSSFLFMYAMAFKYGVYLVVKREMFPSDVYRVLFSISFVTNNSGAATAYFPDYIKASYAAGLINKLLDEKETMREDDEDGSKQIEVGKIEGSDLHFRYEQRPNQVILDGIDVSLEPGKTLALVGPSGCGKSTIISLLEKFYTPTEGELKIDDGSVENTNLFHLRSSLALVSQEPVLFNCSIAENLVYGLKSKVDRTRINESLRTANAYNFVYDLPQGLDTIVGERGAQLSGGQKQRIAIARALLRNPKILLLDEATSALDSDSEKIVQNALDTASERLSTVIVAHRLSTIVNADKIAVLKAGKIVECGTHDELIKLKKSYWRLVQKQNLLSEC